MIRFFKLKFDNEKDAKKIYNSILKLAENCKSELINERQVLYFNVLNFGGVSNFEQECNNIFFTLYFDHPEFLNQVFKNNDIPFSIQCLKSGKYNVKHFYISKENSKEWIFNNFPIISEKQHAELMEKISSGKYYKELMENEPRVLSALSIPIKSQEELEKHVQKTIKNVKEKYDFAEKKFPFINPNQEAANELASDIERLYGNLPKEWHYKADTPIVFLNDVHLLNRNGGKTLDIFQHKA